jgi:hypothetical protein
MERSDRNPGLGPISDQGVLLLRPKFDDDDGVLDEPTDEKDLPYRADPWAAVARSQVDPFSRVNFDCGPSTQAILHHCKSTVMTFLAREKDLMLMATSQTPG